ncbi:uncharacterized protein LOC134256124 [Saccostrea cucullata]|uniref:uncharacterized protein LOC134256124 n=1 Tax=Saccostrea cuccullata TaxID=36930 RepID=UPI002ED5BC58
MGEDPAACTFPDELRGTWHSSHKGALTFSNTTISEYPIQMSALVSSLDFVCQEKSGSVYLLKSPIAVIAFGQLIDSYLCLDIQRISATKYKYYIGTTMESSINDYVYGIMTQSTISMSDACNRATPYEQGTFITLVKDGEVYTGSAQASCPPNLLAAYSTVTIKNSDESTTCSGNSFDGCSQKLTFKLTYEACASGLTFSTLGDFYCLHSQTSGGITYTIVWNNDTSVTGSSTYRSTCYASQTIGSTLYATEYPGFCQYSNQTSTYVFNQGIKYTMTSQTATCVITKEGGGSGFYYFLIVLGILLVAAIAFVIFIIYKKYKNKIRMMELEVYTEETKSRPQTSMTKENDDRAHDQVPKLPPIFPNKPLVQSNEPVQTEEPASEQTTVEPISSENTEQTELAEPTPDDN